MKIKNRLSLITVMILLASCSQPTTDPLPEVDNNTYLEIINYSSTPFWGLYCTDTINNSWGENLLGDLIIASGDTYKVAINPGTVDIRVDTQATYGQGNGAWEQIGVVINDKESFSKALYDS